MLNRTVAGPIKHYGSRHVTHWTSEITETCIFDVCRKWLCVILIRAVNKQIILGGSNNK